MKSAFYAERRCHGGTRLSNFGPLADGVRLERAFGEGHRHIFAVWVGAVITVVSAVRVRDAAVSLAERGFGAGLFFSYQAETKSGGPQRENDSLPELLIN